MIVDELFITLIFKVYSQNFANVMNRYFKKTQPFDKNFKQLTNLTYFGTYLKCRIFGVGCIFVFSKRQKYNRLEQKISINFYLKYFRIFFYRMSEKGKKCHM